MVIIFILLIASISIDLLYLQLLFLTIGILIKFFFLVKMYGEKAWWQLHKNSASNIEQVLQAVPHKAAAVRPPTTYHKNYPS